MFSLWKEKTLSRGKRIGSVEGLRVVLLCRIRGGVWANFLEVNKPCGVMKEACCGQREELSKVPSMRRPVVMDMASMAVVEGGKARSGHWDQRGRLKGQERGPVALSEMGAAVGMDWPLCVGLSSCVSSLLWCHCSQQTLKATGEEDAQLEIR